MEKKYQKALNKFENFTNVSLRADEDLVIALTSVMAYHSTHVVSPTKVDVIKGLVQSELDDILSKGDTAFQEFYEQLVAKVKNK